MKLKDHSIIITGGASGIGYQAGLKLLRCGAELIVTTRFPRDSARRYASEPDFGEWGRRLQIFGLDLRHTPSVEAFCKTLLETRSFVYTTVGMAAMTFALGGMAYWMPTFFARVRGLPLDEANTLFGGITVAAGLVGTFLGGWLGDWLLKRTDKAYLIVSGVGMLLGVPALWIGLTSADRSVYLPAIFITEVMVFLNTGPANAVIVSVVLPEIRAYGRPVWHVFAVRCPARRDELFSYLAERSIDANIHYPTPIHRQVCYAERWAGQSFPVAEMWARDVLSLPLNSTHTNSEILAVIEAVTDFLSLPATA